MACVVDLEALAWTRLIWLRQAPILCRVADAAFGDFGLVLFMPKYALEGGASVACRAGDVLEGEAHGEPARGESLAGESVGGEMQAECVLLWSY